MQIGDYTVEGELGRGGMGAVYRARAKDGSRVAVKLLTGAAPEQVARFERERRLLGAFTAREGFVPLLDAGVSAQGPYLVMPLLAGGTLRERLDRGPLSVADTIELGRTLAFAIGCAHARGIVHRDLKPENVLFDLDGAAPGAPGRPLVADLGIGKHFDRRALGASHSVALSARGALLGTAAYMAPEQLEDATGVGPPADVFALGAILHECLAGEPAFGGQSVLDIFTKRSSGQLPALAPKRPDAPSWLVKTIERCMNPDPALRFRDGTALARVLRARGGARRGLVVLGLVLIVLGFGGAAPTIGPGRARRAPRGSVTRAAPSETAGAPIETAVAPVETGRDDPVVGAIVARAKARAAAKDWDGAIAGISEAIELSPGRPVFWSDRAEWKIEKGDVPGALSDFSRAVELDPKNPVRWSNRGITKLVLSDFAGGAADAEEAMRLGSSVPETWLVRGQCRQRLGEREGAIADFEHYLEMTPGNPQTKAVRAEIDALEAERSK